MVCVDPNDIPAIAIVDAELMYTLPQGLTASTGLDALTHAIEGLITKGAWEMSAMFEIKALEMIARYLETAVFEPTNAEARNGMAVAQYIAGCLLYTSRCAWISMPYASPLTIKMFGHNTDKSARKRVQISCP